MQDAQLPQAPIFPIEEDAVQEEEQEEAGNAPQAPIVPIQEVEQEEAGNAMVYLSLAIIFIVQSVVSPGPWPELRI